MSKVRPAYPIPAQHIKQLSKPFTEHCPLLSNLTRSHVYISIPYPSRIVLNWFQCLAIARVGAARDRSVRLVIKSFEFLRFQKEKDSPEAPTRN